MLAVLVWAAVAILAGVVLAMLALAALGERPSWPSRPPRRHFRSVLWLDPRAARGLAARRDQLRNRSGQ